MEAYIKYKGNVKDSYCRYGKIIPFIETKIDISKYFSCNQDRAKYIASQLLSDSRIDCRLQKSASDSVRKMQEGLESKATNKDKLLDDRNKRLDSINNEIQKPKAKNVEIKKADNKEDNIVKDK